MGSVFQDDTNLIWGHNVTFIIVYHKPPHPYGRDIGLTGHFGNYHRSCSMSLILQIRFQSYDES